jgi:hypothetical protein
MKVLHLKSINNDSLFLQCINSNQHLYVPEVNQVYKVEHAVYGTDDVPEYPHFSKSMVMPRQNFIALLQSVSEDKRTLPILITLRDLPQYKLTPVEFNPDDLVLANNGRAASRQRLPASPRSTNQSIDADQCRITDLINAALAKLKADHNCELTLSLSTQRGSVRIPKLDTQEFSLTVERTVDFPIAATLFGPQLLALKIGHYHLEAKDPNGFTIDSLVRALHSCFPSIPNSVSSTEPKRFTFTDVATVRADWCDAKRCHLEVVYPNASYKVLEFHAADNHRLPEGLRALLPAKDEVENSLEA